MATTAKLMVQLGLDDQFSSKMNKVAGSLTSIGAGLTAAVTLPLAAVGMAAVKMASDLHENINKTNVVFGESAVAVQQWSTTTATSLGISRNEALQATSTFGNLLTNFGLSQDAAAGMSMDIVKLSADLGSFNNLPTTQVLEAIRSGLVGESEPLKQLGIDVSDATVKAKALALGLWDGNGALTAAARAQTVLALVTEQGGNANNDFIETANGMANQTKILRAQLADAGATIGMVLLPFLTQLLQKANEVLGGFSGLSATQQKYILILAGIAAAMGPVLLVLSQLVLIAPAIGTAFTIMTGPVGLVIAALAALFIAYQTNFLGFADGVNAAAAKVSQTFNDLKPTIQAVADVMSTAFTAALPTLTAAFDLVVTHVTETFQNVKRILDGYVNIIRGVMQIIKGIFTLDWGLIKTGVTNIVTGMKDVVGGILDQLITNLKFALGIAKMVFSLAWNAIKDKAVEVVSSTADKVVSIITGLASDIYNGAYNVGYSIGQGLIAGLNAIWDSVVGFVTSLMNTVMDIYHDIPFVNSPSKVTTYVGEMMGEGLIAGMASTKKDVLRSADALAQASIPTPNWRAVDSAMSSITGPSSAGTNYGGVTNHFHIDGSKDPQSTADAVFAKFAREMALTTGGV